MLRAILPAALLALLGSAWPLRAQVAGANNIVINEIASQSTSDHAVELYNYGADQVMTNWVLRYNIDFGTFSLTYSYTVPAFTLPRHALVTVHWASGTNTATDLYTGSAAGYSANGELTLLDGVGGGVDYIRWGSPVPTNQPADLDWRGVVNWTTTANPLYRTRDLNVRGSADWGNGANPTDGALNAGQVGTRPHGRVMINEFYSGTTAAAPWIEIFNPNPVLLGLSGGKLEAYDGGATPCYTFNFGGASIAGGGFLLVTPTLGACNWWNGSTGVQNGEIRITDAVGEGWDYLAFNTITTHHQPGGVTAMWTGGDFPMKLGTLALYAYRNSNTDSDNSADWDTSTGHTQSALNAGQQTVGLYDELGSEYTATSAGGAGTARGNVIDVTGAFTLKEFKARIQTTATSDLHLVVRQLTATGPEVWTSIYDKPLLSMPAQNGVFTTGPITLVFDAPGSYAFLVYGSAGFSYFRAPAAEQFRYGNFVNVRGDSYPPAATSSLSTVISGYAMSQYFVTAAGPDISPTTVPNAEIGVPYSQTFASATGVPAVTWGYSGAAIPGLSFNTATHILSGTPTTTGTYNFSLTATDANGATDTQAYTVIVRSAITITTTTLPDAEVGFAYYQYLYPSGGQSPNAWSEVSVFPAWLTLGTYASYWGRLTGTPAAAGAVSITVRVDDALGGTDSQSYNFTVQPALAITTTTLTGGQVGTFYTRTLGRSGGVAPYSWKILSGLQPNGLALDPVTGVLSGTPQAAGTFNFTVELSDYYTTDTQAYSLTITQPLMVVNTALPAGIQNAAYPVTQMIAAGGNTPYGWSITSGALPPGLNMTSGGVISGTPTTIGNSSFTVRVTDAGALIASRNLSIAVTAPPDTPQWSQRALFGGVIDRLVYSPNYATDNTIFTASGYGAEIYRSNDKGGTWQRITVDPDNAGQYITGLALSPVFLAGGASVDQKTVFASGWSIGVWKSVDGGLTFTENSNGLVSLYNINALAVSPDYVNDRTLWLAKAEASNNIYISTDAAANWTLAGSLPGGGGSTVIGVIPSPDFANDRTLFAFNSLSDFRSVNGGTTWTSVYTPPGAQIGNLAVSPDYPIDHTLWINAGAGELHRSRDGGTSWAKLTTVGYALDTVRRPGLTPWLFMRAGSSSGNYNLLRSDNQGDSFVPLYAHALLPTGAVPSARSLSVSPLLAGPAADIFSGSSFGVTASFDNGFSFNNRQKGLSALDINGLCQGGSVQVAATNNGWLKSADSGLSWGQAPSPGGSSGIRYCAVSPNYNNDDQIFLVTGIGSSGNPGLYRSDDDGISFTNVYNSSQIGALTLAPGYGTANSTLFIAVGSQLYRSTNAGGAFTLLPLGAACDTGNIKGIAVSPNYATDGAIFISREYAGGTGDGPCRTTNSGTTWTPLLDAGDTPVNGSVWLPPNYNDDVISAAYSRVIMLVFDGFEGAQYDESGLWRSADNGATWTQVSAQPQPPYDILYGSVVFSPNFATDNTVFAAILNARHEGDGIWRSSNGGVTFAPLSPATDELLTRSTSALMLLPGFNGGSGGVAIAGTQGSGLWRSATAGQDFHPTVDMVMASKYVNGYAAHPVNGTPLYAATNGNGVFISDDDGLTFTPFSRGLPAKSNVKAITCPAASPDNPVVAVAARGLYRWNGSSWINTFASGNFTAFTQDASYLYASRVDGVSLRSGNGGQTWATQQAAEGNLSAIADASQAGFAAPAKKPAGKAVQGPATPSAVTASLWAVAQNGGPRYSLNSGASWIASPGGNDYVVPNGQVWTVVQPLDINAQSGGRTVLAGSSTGLWRSSDGGATWRVANAPGSGLEASSGNFGAVLGSTTSFGSTDVLVGAIGTTTGGVYLSGDGGEHWTILNNGFDPNSLSITTLVKTSCGGCPVQYYSGSYGSGVYTRTIAVSAPPAVTGWYFGSTSGTCGTATICATAGAACGAEQGGQPFKLCGSGFQALPVVEFDGVPATGCVMSSATVITCTGTPPHIPGGATVRVRNTDTRAGLMGSPYAYTGGAPRVANSLHVAKSGSDAGLTWSCVGCTAGNPARVYRSQDAPFTLYLEQYNGGTGGSYTNTGALAPAANPSYFWSVE